ncbi:MAG: class I SAM-dependent RNA methyltransferase [Anaerolineales bacterium]|nr:class I SAM-dependent RNA methyltransferase [Anaerolineales bacterium]
MNKSHIVQISGFAYGGEAFGRLPDGRMVFAPYVMPGETVRLRLIEEKRGYARAQLVEVLQPEARRVTPRCVHFGECGGCHYQFMPYEMQLSAKEMILRDQLERIGGMSDPPIQAIVPSPRPFGYRNHVQFHLSPEGKLGYHRERSDEVIAIQECHLPQPPLDRIWPQLDFEATTEIERIGLRLGKDEDVQIILESSHAAAPEIVVEELPVSVVHLSPAGTLVLAGSQSVEMQVLERDFIVSGGSFFQVNTEVAGYMVQHVLDELRARRLLNGKTVFLDLYCGVGLFSAFVAPYVGQVIGVESSPSAAADYEANLDEFDHVALYEAPVEWALPDIDARPDVILVDPPRSGLDRKALDALIEMRAALLVYVSCDPATLARDAKRLITAGYRMNKITPFDMFPQTYHIESISFWSLG